MSSHILVFQKDFRNKICVVFFFSMILLVSHLPFFQDNSSSQQLLKNNLKQEKYTQTEVFPNKVLDPEINNNFLKNSSISANNDSSNITWGKPLRIVPSNLQRGDFVATQGPNGSLHCIWKQKVTHSGISLFHSTAENELGVNWSTPDQITHSETDISQLVLAGDLDGTLHLFFISSTEHFHRIYYCSKYPTEEVWNQEVLTTSSSYEFSSLTTCFSKDNTLNVAWIATDKKTTDRSSIYYQQKQAPVKKWLSSPAFFFNASNPKIVDLVGLDDDLIGMCWTNTTSNQIGDLIHYNQFDPQTLTLSIPEEIAETDQTIGALKIYFTPTENAVHFLWRIDVSTTRIYHRQRFNNGTMPTNPVLISYVYSNCDIGGLAEDPITGNIYFIYEDSSSTAISDLYLRKKLSGKTVWEPNREKITENSCSRLPIFFSNNQDGILGQLFHHSYNSVVTTPFDITEQWLPSTVIYQTSFYDSEPSFDIDSEGTIHLVWKHRGINSQERILYQTKQFNEPWGEITIINQSLDGQGRPQIIVDQDDHLHCIFAAETGVTSYSGLFYTTKLLSEPNWSKPILIKTPENYLEDIPIEILVDSNYNVHVFWSEQVDDFSNRLLYASKTSSSQNFTIQFIPSDEFSYNLYPNAVIDNNGTIHLVYVKENSISEDNEILYRYKPLHQNWSEPLSLATTTTNYFQQPVLTCDFQNTLNLIYLRRIPVGEQLLASTVNHWQKEMGNDWTFMETLFENQLIDNHNSFTAVNDSVIYLYHMKYYTEGKLEDKIALKRFNSQNSSWQQEEVLFQNPNYGTIPTGEYDGNSDQTYFILLDKKSSFPHLNWLTNQQDSDRDSLGDYDELIFNTDPLIVDSDLDLLADGLEVSTYFTNPANNDSDWDRLEDGSEILTHLTDPKNADSDEDQLFDGEEVAVWFTDPTNKDTDQDSLTDYQEIYLLETNPNAEDTDGDGMPDPFEIENGLNPIIEDSQEDNDEDELSNIGEYLNGTDPNNPDCDEDFLLDGEEIHIWNTDPLDLDSDDDTISDYDEVITFHTNPNKQDSDDDGFSDREEINAGTNPNDSQDNEKRRRINRILISVLAPTITIIIIIVSIEIWYRIKEKRLQEKEEDEIKQEEAKLEQLMDKKQKP
ncbi:MAG: hypothetical protein GF308_05740 [Candidatus Heimdallarchaeota archaeon]|nr:hypothetical protein [Candidatus Heimdallarchaeota archaeon]